MKVKLPLPEGKVITMKLDHNIAHKCYENNLRSRRDMYMISTHREELYIKINLVPHDERRLGLAREV